MAPKSDDSIIWINASINLNREMCFANTRSWRMDLDPTRKALLGGLSAESSALARDERISMVPEFRAKSSSLLSA